MEETKISPGDVFREVSLDHKGTRGGTYCEAR